MKGKESSDESLEIESEDDDSRAFAFKEKIQSPPNIVKISTLRVRATGPSADEPTSQSKHRLTNRQRTLYQVKEVEESVPVLSQTTPISQPLSERAAEKSEKRRLQRQLKLEQTRKATIERLLTTSQSSTRRLESGNFNSSAAEVERNFLNFIDYRLLRKRDYDALIVREISEAFKDKTQAIIGEKKCAVCGEPSKYAAAKGGIRLCSSIECYRSS